MSLQIKNINAGWPAGGFPFTDSRSGKSFPAMEADIRLQVQNIIAHRRANIRLFNPQTEGHLFNPTAVQAELIAFVCRKNPSVCFDDNPNSQIAATVSGNVHNLPDKSCWRCSGHLFIVHLCPTCGGQKQDAWICATGSCGAVNAI